MENENHQPQTENQPKPIEFEGGVPRQDLEFGLRIITGQFTNEHFENGRSLAPDEELEKTLRADTRLRQHQALEKSKSYDNNVKSWTEDLLKKINTLKEKHPEQTSLLQKIFGDEITHTLNYSETDDEETQKTITERREKLAQDFRLRFFDRDGRELKDGNFFTFLQKQVYNGSTNLTADVQRDYELLQTLTTKLYGSDNRLIRFSLSINNTAGSPIITERLQHGNFDVKEKLNELQKQRLAQLDKAQKHADQIENRLAPEIPANTRRTLELAQSIIQQQNDKLFLRHFITPERDIPLEGEPTEQLDKWFLIHMGRHATTKEHETYITADGQLRKTIAEIKQEQFNTPEYQDKATTRDSLLHIYKTVKGIEPHQLAAEKIAAFHKEFTQYFYAASTLGLSLDEIKVRFLTEITKDYDKQLEDLKKKQPNTETNVDLLAQKIKDHKEKAKNYQDQTPLRNEVAKLLKQAYDGEVNIALTEKLIEIQNINTLAKQAAEAQNAKEKRAAEEQLSQAIYQVITTDPNYQNHKTLLISRLQQIQQQTDYINQMIGNEEENAPESISARRKINESLAHPDFAQAIAKRDQLPQLKTYRADNILFAYDPSLPEEDLKARLEEFKTIAEKRSKALNQHKRDKQPIVVLVLSDNNVIESQTSADGEVILMNYGDNDPNIAQRIAKQRGQFAHEVTHAITYQQTGQTPAFAINEAIAYGSQEDFTSEQSYERLTAGSPFRANISEREKEGYLLAGYIYDLIRKYATSSQQANQIFNAVAYNEAARWDLTLEHTQFALKSGKVKDANNVALIKNSLPVTEGPSFTVKETEEKPPVTNSHLLQHIYSLLGRDFRLNFTGGENPDLTNYIKNQGFVYEQDENKKRIMLNRAVNQPIDFMPSEYQQQIRGAA